MEAGATIAQELRDEDYGSRGYMARDPEGHYWYFGTYRPGAYWQDGTCKPSRDPRARAKRTRALSTDC